MAHDPNAMVAGQRYGRANKLRTDTAQPFGAPVNTRRLAVYRAIAFDVGIEDRTPVN